MAIPSTRQLTQQVKQAMQMFAPELYRRLEASGELETYAEQKAETMLNEFGEQMSGAWIDAASANPAMSPMQHVQQLSTAERQIWEGIVANHLEFPEETTTASRPAN